MADPISLIVALSSNIVSYRTSLRLDLRCLETPGGETENKCGLSIHPKTKHIVGMARWGKMTDFVYPNNIYSL